jgi:hypothetical protein
MATSLAAEYPIELEVISKPFAEYRTSEYAATEQPCAPAIMVGDELITEGADVSDEVVENEIRKQLGMPPAEKKGVLRKLFGK